MAYLGNSPGVSSQRVVTTYNVASSTTVFTPTSGYSLGYLDVYLNGVKLILGDDYTATNGTTFTLASAAVSGDVVEAVSYTPRGLSDGYTKAEADAKYPVKPTGTPSGSKFLRDDNSWQTVTAPSPTAVSDQANTSTGYFDLPSGTTAQRPGTPNAGMTRFNTDLGTPEWYNPSTSSWIAYSATPTYIAEYLVIAGGGGGGITVNAGGGGAGGVLSGTYTVTTGAVLSVVVGGGGATAVSGSNSSVFGATSIGGGAGGAGTSGAGSSGGSGGGGGYNGSGAGAGTSGQGYAGASGTNAGPGYPSGGGGGAAGVGLGGNSAGANGGGPGTGSFSAWATATSTGSGGYYAGGGAGGTNIVGGASTGGIGGGGGAGGNSGAANTGSGGGGASNNVYGSGTTGNNGGAGGSGVVIIRYLGVQRATGGTVTSSGGYTYHTFTSSGTFTA